jgi:hypothetical protein
MEKLKKNRENRVVIDYNHQAQTSSGELKNFFLTNLYHLSFSWSENLLVTMA